MSQRQLGRKEGARARADVPPLSQISRTTLQGSRPSDKHTALTAVARGEAGDWNSPTHHPGSGEKRRRRRRRQRRWS
eukprot:366178-Chlamydomonas_euryale.AAC.7